LAYSIFRSDLLDSNYGSNLARNEWEDVMVDHVLKEVPLWPLIVFVVIALVVVGYACWLEGIDKGYKDK